ncbi:MAG: hypothetical protein ACLUNO_03655 [Oscillospiraceae bacterium]
MSFHEPYASSACELMAELLEELVEQPDILHVEAEAMLSGIMLRHKGTSPCAPASARLRRRHSCAAPERTPPR